MNVTFVISGNPKHPFGNAVPKLKMTGKQSWMPKAQQYKAWKTHVRGALLEQIMKQVVLNRQEIISFLYADKQPFATTEKNKHHMHLEIFWSDRTHGDPENIFGSIADALYKQDKYLDGSFHSQYATDGRGRVEVTITT